MTAPRLTTESVEAAAKRYWQVNGDDRQWSDLVPVEQDQLRFEAGEVVEAALPLLAPQPVVDREALEQLVDGAHHYDTCDLSLSPLTNQFGCSCLLADLRALLNGTAK